MFGVELQVLEGRTCGQAVKGVVEESRHLLELLRRREFHVKTSEEQHELVKAYLRTVLAGRHFLNETTELLLGEVMGWTSCRAQVVGSFFHNIIIVLMNMYKGRKRSKEALIACLFWNAGTEQALRDSLDSAQSLSLAIAELLAEAILILFEFKH